MRLLPLQCHCQQKQCACVSIVPARGAVQCLVVHHHHLSHQGGQKKTGPFTSATPADYFQLAKLPAANLLPTCLQLPAGSHSWIYCCSKSCWSLSTSYFIVYLILWHSFYKTVIPTKKTPSEQKARLLKSLGLSFGLIALQLKFLQKTCIS